MCGLTVLIFCQHKITCICSYVLQSYNRDRDQTMTFTFLSCDTRFRNTSIWMGLKGKQFYLRLIKSCNFHFDKLSILYMNAYMLFAHGIALQHRLTQNSFHQFSCLQSDRIRNFGDHAKPWVNFTKTNISAWQLLLSLVF